MHVFGHDVGGLEVIGHLQPWVGAVTGGLVAGVYFSDGRTPDFVYEMTGNDLTIWFRHKGSDNFMRGRLDPQSGVLNRRSNGPVADIGWWEPGWNSLWLPCVCRMGVGLTSLCSGVALSD